MARDDNEVLIPKPCPQRSGQFIEQHEDELRKGNIAVQHMKSELLRMNSFKHRPHDSYKGVWPSQLAKAGLYYDPRSEETICFICDFRKQASFWVRGTNPMNIHRSESPECLYITGHCNENVPFHSRNQRSKFSDILPEKSTDESMGNPGKLVADIEEPADAPKHFSLQSYALEPNPNTFELRRNYSQRKAENRAGAGIRFDGSGSEQLQRLKSEADRLMTFKGWPKGSCVSLIDLAKAGFFYTGKDDRVQCEFCQGVLRNWEAGDNPRFEHRKHFPRCPFVQKFDVLNVPISNQTAMQRLKDEERRLMTFTRWPKGSGVSPENLARAGFFYTGTNDQVQCAFCEKTLMNWEHGDDPMAEHWKHVPRCPFVQQYDVGNIPIPHEERTRARVFYLSLVLFYCILFYLFV